MKLDYSQERMAELFGVTRSSYCRYESGKAFPGPSGLEKLASSFNVSLDWLVSGKGRMFTKENGRSNGGMEMRDLKPDMRDMVGLMHKMPLIRFKVLSFYYEFKKDHPDVFVND
jgi:transcriptional regulator with XRE-family HTH domain